LDRNRLGHRLADKAYQLRGRNGRAAPILQIPRVAWLDVSIFNPRLDPDGELANRLAALTVGGVASIRNVL
jgi:hypothetical protein